MSFKDFYTRLGRWRLARSFVYSLFFSLGAEVLNRRRPPNRSQSTLSALRSSARRPTNHWFKNSTSNILTSPLKWREITGTGGPVTRWLIM